MKFMEEVELEGYFKAGEVVHKVLEASLSLVSEGKEVIKICEQLEREIVRLGAKPAFPVNISINQIAAHYTSPPGDETTIPPGALVKVDVGAQVEGYIADGAITIALSEEHEDLVEASKEALKAAEGRLRSGVNLGKIGGIIERIVKTRGFKTVRNLSGHLISRYNLHAGKSVPNIATFTLDRAKAGEVYAIEPFVTDGAGRVKDSNEIYIFSLYSLKGLKNDKKLMTLAERIWREYRCLPFAARWLTKFNITDLWGILRRLVERGALYPYPVLIEEGAGLVAQWEDTLIVKEHGVINLTRTIEILR